jgi:hypothetical protein
MIEFRNNTLNLQFPTLNDIITFITNADYALPTLVSYAKKGGRRNLVMNFSSFDIPTSQAWDKVYQYLMEEFDNVFIKSFSSGTKILRDASVVEKGHYAMLTIFQSDMKDFAAGKMDLSATVPAFLAIHDPCLEQIGEIVELRRPLEPLEVLDWLFQENDIEGVILWGKEVSVGSYDAGEGGTFITTPSLYELWETKTASDFVYGDEEKTLFQVPQSDANLPAVVNRKIVCGYVDLGKAKTETKVKEKVIKSNFKAEAWQA